MELTSSYPLRVTNDGCQVGKSMAQRAPFHWALHAAFRALGTKFVKQAQALFFCHGWFFATETNEHHPVVLYKMFEYLITYQYIINLNQHIPMADNRNQVWLQCRVWKALKLWRRHNYTKRTKHEWSDKSCAKFWCTSRFSSRIMDFCENREWDNAWLP